mmetsp:Transcript_2549/g.7534  ORF Transcript_2549/g.7534 Transcript_2549/m.7534 type:complete len:371 (+) Transcript_2549:277-1389(+)
MRRESSSKLWSKSGQPTAPQCSTTTDLSLPNMESLVMSLTDSTSDFWCPAGSSYDHSRLGSALVWPSTLTKMAMHLPEPRGTRHLSSVWDTTCGSAHGVPPTVTLSSTPATPKLAPRTVTSSPPAPAPCDGHTVVTVGASYVYSGCATASRPSSTTLTGWLMPVPSGAMHDTAPSATTLAPKHSLSPTNARTDSSLVLTSGKFSPRMVISVPPAVGPCAGCTLCTTGWSYMNCASGYDCRPATSTCTLASLAYPTGTLQCSTSFDTHSVSTHGLPPTVTVAAPALVPKLVPSTVIIVCASGLPNCGSTLSIMGALYVNSAFLLSVLCCPPTVTTTAWSLPTPAGTSHCSASSSSHTTVVHAFPPIVTCAL